MTDFRSPNDPTDISAQRDSQLPVVHNSSLDIDLSQLDLSEINIEEEEPLIPFKGALFTLLFFGLLGLLLWLPKTSFYLSRGSGSWLTGLFAIVAAALGLIAGRWFMDWAEARGKRLAPLKKREFRPPTAVMRTLTLIAVAGSGGFILFGLPTFLSSELWFLSACGALGVGLLFIRWLMMQAYNPIKIKKVMTLPPWFKWISLAVLVILGLVVWFMGSDGGAANSTNKGMGSIGFFVGVGLAIWIVRRFDEIERKARK